MLFDLGITAIHILGCGSLHQTTERWRRNSEALSRAANPRRPSPVGVVGEQAGRCCSAQFWGAFVQRPTARSRSFSVDSKASYFINSPIQQACFLFPPQPRGFCGPKTGQGDQNVQNWIKGPHSQPTPTLGISNKFYWGKKVELGEILCLKSTKKQQQTGVLFSFNLNIYIRV